MSGHGDKQGIIGTAADPEQDGLDLTAAAIMVALTMAWGLNNVAIKFANLGFQPVFQSGMRMFLGIFLMLGWCVLRRVRLFERDGSLLPGLSVGIIFGVEFLLLYLGLDYTSSARGVVFFFCMPFFVALGAHFLVPGERLTTAPIIGLGLAFAGVALAFADKLSLPSPQAYFGDILCLVGGLLWAADTLIMKTTRLGAIAAEKSMLYRLTIGALVQLAAAPLFGPFIRDVDGMVILAFLFQLFVVVGITYRVWVWLVSVYPASRVASFGFLSPVFGVLFGAILLREPVGLQLIGALGLVALGIYLVNRPGNRKAAAQ